MRALDAAADAVRGVDGDDRQAVVEVGRAAVTTDVSCAWGHAVGEAPVVATDGVRCRRCAEADGLDYVEVGGPARVVGDDAVGVASEVRR